MGLGDQYCGISVHGAITLFDPYKCDPWREIRHILKNLIFSVKARPL